MWFEILPSYLIICLTVAAPHYIAPGINYLGAGNMYRRKLETHEQRMQYLRDRRLAGCPYKVIGLDGVEDLDEDEEEEKKKKAAAAQKNKPPSPPPPEAYDYCADKNE